MYVTLCDVMCCVGVADVLGRHIIKQEQRGVRIHTRVQNSVRGIHTRRGPDGRF